MSLTNSSFYILSDGTVKACGYNGSGQLGIGNTTQQNSPVTVPIFNVKQIACGYYHTVFLLNDGTVKACGYNYYGQLGIGNTTNQTSPVTVPVSNVKQIACGYYHTVFLLYDGTVKACGYNGSGQLGIGNTTQQNSPVTVPIFNVKQISCGEYHTVFLLNDDTVKACGYNNYGQLGIGNTTQQNSPITVSISNVKQISCGYSHTVFLLNDGTVKACGYNNYGQLGIGNTTNQITLVTVPISNVKQISCGSYHTIFLLNNGTVKACGYNGSGQLGIGNTTQQNSPVTVPIFNVKQISCGEYHTVFLLNDDTVKACGRNDYGQLGIGNTNQTSPVTVPISGVIYLMEILKLLVISYISEKLVVLDSIVSYILFKVEGEVVGQIIDTVINQEYIIQDFIEEINYGDILSIGAYDSNDTLLDTLIFATERQGLLLTYSTISTVDKDNISMELNGLYTEGYILLSNDNKNTWYTYKNNNFVLVSDPQIDIFTEGIDSTQNSPVLTKQDFLTDNLDVMVGVRSSDINDNPVIKYITLKYYAYDNVVLDKPQDVVVVNNLVPVLTSNTSASPIVVSASTIAGGANDVWKAFDNNVTTYFATNQLPNGWLKVDTGISTPMNCYTVQVPNNSDTLVNMPKNWTFEGSNDDINWNILDTRSNETGWVVGQKRTYLLDSPVEYRYYRINISANNGGTWVGFGEFNIVYDLSLLPQFVYAPDIADEVYKFTVSVDGDYYKVYLSNNGGNTWYTYNGIEFVEGGEGNSIYEINALNEEDLLQFLPISNFRMKFIKLNDEAQLNKITINYKVKTNELNYMNSEVALLPIPPEYYRNVLQQDRIYTLKLEEGICIDDAEVDYNFYSTPNAVKIRPLDMGTVVGTKTSDIYAFEVINSFDNTDFNITLEASYNGELAQALNNKAYLPDAEYFNDRTVVQLSLTEEPFSPVYPLMVRLNSGQKQVVYIKIKPTVITTTGGKAFQIRLKADPV